MKIYEDFRSAVSGARVYCPNCSQPNPVENETCDECGADLLKPASFPPNVIETIAKPMRAMARIAATAPVLQAFLIVIGATAVQLLVESLSILQFWQYFYENPGKVTDTLIERINSNSLPNKVPDPGLMLVAFLIFTVSWALFSGAIYLCGRLFYKQQVPINYDSVLSVVGFSRISYLSLLLLVTVLTLAPSLAGLGNVLSLIPLVWQLTLIIFGVKAITGLNYNRTIVLVLVPALLFLFLLPMFLGLSLPI